MTGFLSQYGDALQIAFVIMVLFLTVAAALAAYLRVTDRSLRPVARLLAIGSAVVVFVSTALPRTWPPQFSQGELVLRLGDGGLSDWRVIYEDPDSLGAVLLVGNVVLYMPLAAFAMLGWPRHPSTAFGACLAVSLVVESSQRLFLEGVASIDDVLLNMGGAVIGFAIGLWLHHRARSRGQPVAAGT